METKKGTKKMDWHMIQQRGGQKKRGEKYDVNSH